MQQNFDRSLALVLRSEGGFVNNPKDPGGATNKGVTLETFRRTVKADATVADLKAITPAQVAAVYRKHYWDAVRGDDLPSGVDYAVFDYAVNSGPGKAAKHLQGVVGAPIDGSIGPTTLKAAHQARPADIVKNLCSARLRFLQGLPTWPTFGRGWNSRVISVQAQALAMAG